MIMKDVLVKGCLMIVAVNDASHSSITVFSFRNTANGAGLSFPALQSSSFCHSLDGEARENDLGCLCVVHSCSSAVQTVQSEDSISIIGTLCRAHAYQRLNKVCRAVCLGMILMLLEK
jgi:hypothetical protein